MERNRPSDDGRMIGAELAGYADAAEKRFAREAGFIPVRCPSCAFRKGTYPNGCLPTVADAMKCSMERRPFHCHSGLKGNGASHVCGGWMLVAGLPVPARTAPWPFSDDAAGLDKLGREQEKR